MERLRLASRETALEAQAKEMDAAAHGLAWGVQAQRRRPVRLEAVWVVCGSAGCRGAPLSLFVCEGEGWRAGEGGAGMNETSMHAPMSCTCTMTRTRESHQPSSSGRTPCSQWTTKRPATSIGKPELQPSLDVGRRGSTDINPMGSEACGITVLDGRFIPMTDPGRHLELGLMENTKGERPGDQIALGLRGMPSQS